MYTNSSPEDVEEVCYDRDHIALVVAEIKKNFDKWFDKFTSTNDSNDITTEQFNILKRRFKVSVSLNESKENKSDKYRKNMSEAIGKFEKDRKAYLEIFDPEALEEYEYDPAAFKSKVLRNECPIIHNTLYSDAEVLKDFKMDFNAADPNELLRVVSDLCKFEKSYKTEVYDEKKDVTYEDLGLSILDTEEYKVRKVIGGGIKSHMLYKVKPAYFPNRSRDALWAMWFLTDKKDFGCVTDSEFLMIDSEYTITQQNYFYPYALFSYYAFKIYGLLKEKASELNVAIDENYRYVIVDSFLSFVASQHRDEIKMHSRQIKEGAYYA